jgi:hypothetical protein
MDRISSDTVHPTRDLRKDYHRVKARNHKVGICHLNRIIYRLYRKYRICTVVHHLVRDKDNMVHRQ